MDSLRAYIVAGAVITVALFASLLVQSTGGFSSARAAPGMSARVISLPSTDSLETVSRISAPATSSAQDRRSDVNISDYEHMAELAEQNRRLRSANQALEERLSSVLNWILANFRGKFPLPEPMFSRVKLAPMVDGALLNPEIGELLKVTHDEEDRMNDAFAFAFDYLHEIEAAILTVASPIPGKVVIHIPKFPEDGAFLREDLYNALESTLGRTRFDRFLKVAEDGLKENFYQFGEASRTMVFELAYVGDDPRPQLLIKDGYVMEIGPNAHSVTAVESILTNLPASYAAYMQWLPEYVNAYAVD